jgi:hypothetical protein
MLNVATLLQAGLFAVFESNVNAQRLCIDGTRLEAVVFVSDDSSSSEAENYIENLESEACPEEGLRLAKENAGGGCFDPGNSSPCRPECQPFATAEGCLNVAQVSPAPNDVSTSQVSAAPTMAGDGTAPPGGSDQPSSVPTDESSIPAPSLSPAANGTSFPTPFESGNGNQGDEPSDMPSQIPTIVGTTLAPSSTNGTGSQQPSVDGNETSVAPTAPSTGDGTQEPSGPTGNATSEPTLDGSLESPPPTGNMTDPPAPTVPTGSPFPTSTPRDNSTGSPAPVYAPVMSPVPTLEGTGENETDAPSPSSSITNPPVYPPFTPPVYAPVATLPPSTVAGSQAPSAGQTLAESAMPSSHPSSFPSPGQSLLPSTSPSVQSAESAMPSSMPSAGPTAPMPSTGPTAPEPAKCRERPIVVPKGKGVYESSDSSDSSSSESSQSKSSKKDKHHKSEKSKKKHKHYHYHRNLQNGRLYEKEGRQNNLVLPKQGTLHDRLLKKSKKDKGKGKGYDDDVQMVKVKVIKHPPPDDDYWDLPFCD